MQKKKVTDSLSLLEHSPKQKQISIIQIPFDWGTDHGSDVGDAPRCILDAGMEKMFKTGGFDVHVSEVPVSEKQRKKFHTKPGDLHEDLIASLSDVREKVKEEINHGRAVVALGGDHTISMGTIAGASAALRGDLGVIWIDIHPDAQTHETSLSKNPHGMPTMTVMGEGDSRLTDIVTHKIKKSNFLYLGARDADKGEILNMRKHKVDVVTMFDIAEHGIKAAIDGVRRLNKKVKRIWVSIDLDSIDESAAPGTTMATPGGFTHREIVTLLTAIGKACDVVGIDIVELTPSRDKEGKTALLALELAAASFGAKYNWYTRYMNEYGDWYSDSKSAV